MAGKTGFILYYEMLDNLKLLGNDMAMEVLSALAKYDQGIETGTLSPQAQFAFNSYIPAMKKAKQRWETSVNNGNQHKSSPKPEEASPNLNEANDNLVEPNHNPDEADDNLNEANTNLGQCVTVNVTDTVNVNVKEKDNNPLPVSPKKPPPPETPPPDKPVETREDAASVFQKARLFWNGRGLKPECRDIMMRPTDTSEILRTFQHYSWEEVRNAIGNYHWHKTEAGPGFIDPPPYGSLAGFLKTGVDRYFDDNALDQQFMKEGK